MRVTYQRLGELHEAIYVLDAFGIPWAAASAVVDNEFGEGIRIEYTLWRPLDTTETGDDE